MSSVQKGSGKKRWMDLYCRGCAPLGQDSMSLNYSPFLNINTPHESSWSLKNGSLYCSSKLWQRSNKGKSADASSKRSVCLTLKQINTILNKCGAAIQREGGGMSWQKPHRIQQGQILTPAPGMAALAQCICPSSKGSSSQQEGGGRQAAGRDYPSVPDNCKTVWNTNLCPVLDRKMLITRSAWRGGHWDSWGWELLLWGSWAGSAEGEAAPGGAGAACTGEEVTEEMEPGSFHKRKAGGWVVMNWNREGLDWV